MTDTTGDTEILRAHSPAEVIAVIPYLLGFHPRDSLVVIGLAGVRVEVTARVGLADLAGELGTARLSETMRIVARSGAERIITVGYVDTDVVPGALPHRALVDELGRAAAAAGLALADALLVAGDRWWSYLCEGSCCPPEGRAVPGDESPAAAGAVYAGLVALPDRDDLAAELRPHDDADRLRLDPVIAEHENLAVSAVVGGYDERRRRSVKRAIFAAARDAGAALFLGDCGTLADDDICRFAVALSETAIRDAVWLAVDQGRLDGRPLWREIARRVPQPYDAAPLFLFGWASWREGNGALAGVAAERALASDPGYSAAELLLGALVHGLDPRRTPRLRMPKSA